MALFVDSAFVSDISRLCQAYPVAGVTTNPSILLAAFERGQRLDDIQMLRELLAACSGTVFMQPTADTREELYRVAQAYVDTDPLRVVLKLPATPTGLDVAREFAPAGARFAFTAVASVSQAYLAAMAGAGWAIPYFCRFRHAGIDVSQAITDMSRVLACQHSATRILAASLKTPSDVIEATLAGADDVTAPPAVIEAMAQHEMTEAAVRQFAEDWQKLRRLA
jgi:TalC/MipB family fructose-6-phosphate aldolase